MWLNNIILMYVLFWPYLCYYLYTVVSEMPTAKCQNKLVNASPTCGLISSNKIRRSNQIAYHFIGL